MKTAGRVTVVALASMILATPARAQSLSRELESLKRAADEWRADLVAMQRDAMRQAQALARQPRKPAVPPRGQDARREAQQRQIGTWPEVTDRLSRTVRLGRNGTFELQNFAGDVIITGGRGDDVRIDATKRVRHRVASAARSILPSVRVDVVERGGNIELRTDQPRRRDVWTAVDYVINLPSGANVILGVGSGNVRIANVSGELRADADDGDLFATDVRRVRHLRTMRGDIEVADAEADELSAYTVEGNLRLRNLKGRVLDLNSVRGDVRLVDVQMNRARLQTMVGDIEYAGPLARSGRYEFATHSGNIRLTPSGGAGFDLEAHSFTGDVRTDYMLKLFKELPEVLRRGAEQRLRGTFGDAAAVLTARSFSGDILIVRR